MLELGEEEVPPPKNRAVFVIVCGRSAVKVAKYLKTNHIIINVRDESDRIKP